MTNHEMAQALLGQAREILMEAGRLLERQAWNLVVRRAQEAAEMALKGALREAGVEVPKVHDVGPTLRDYAQRFPEALRSAIGRLAEISHRLARERALSFYGDEAAGTPPHKIYKSEDASRALEDAQFAVAWCRQILGHEE